MSADPKPSLDFPPKFVVEPRAHRGGLSGIYRARHTVGQLPLALKVFDPQAPVSSEQREQLSQAFIRMGAVMMRLSSQHASVIHTYDCDLLEHDGLATPYVATEWFEGRPLDAVLDEPAPGTPPKLEAEPTVHLFEGILEALALAHDAGIVHADLRPSNIMVHEGKLRPGATLKLMDLFRHRVFRGEASESIEDPLGLRSMVSPSYAAPEQLRGDGDMIGPWTDVYSMALILVEVMLGYPALDGTTEEQLVRASTDPVRRPTPRTLGISVSDPLEEAFTRALAVPTHARFRSMIEFRRALMEATSDQGGARARDPRSTMAVSERDGWLQGDGLAGDFDVDTPTTGELYAQLQGHVRSRVRVASTVRVNDEQLAVLDRQRPPSKSSPPSESSPSSHRGLLMLLLAALVGATVVGFVLGRL